MGVSPTQLTAPEEPIQCCPKQQKAVSDIKRGGSKIGGSKIPDMQTCSVVGMHPSNNYVMQWRSLLVLFLYLPHLWL